MKKCMLAIAVMVALVFNACGIQSKKENKPIKSEKAVNTSQNTATESEKPEETNSSDKKTKEVYNCCGFITDTGVTVKLGGTKGRGLIGMVKLLDNAKQDKAVNGYDFKMLSTAEELNEKLLSGELDMIILPVKAGAKLYGEKDSRVRMLVTGEIDISEKQKKSDNKKKRMITGVFTTEDYIKENKNAVDAFLGDYRYSAVWITNKENIEEAVKLIEEYDAAKADKVGKVVSSGEKACLIGEKMKSVTEDYLLTAKKKGKKAKAKLPKDEFYYIKETK
jgi:hypothetical protein